MCRGQPRHGQLLPRASSPGDTRVQVARNLAGRGGDQEERKTVLEMCQPMRKIVAEHQQKNMLSFYLYGLMYSIYMGHYPDTLLII